MFYGNVVFGVVGVTAARGQWRGRLMDGPRPSELTSF